MNKTFLSLALVATFSISFSVFSADSKEGKDVTATVSYIPHHAQEILDDIDHNIKELKENATELEEKLNKAISDKDKEQIDKLTKNLTTLKMTLAESEDCARIFRNNLDAKYNTSLMNKITTPARYLGTLIANNKNVALALEVTGVAGLSYVIYKSFFAQEEEDEDSL